VQEDGISKFLKVVTPPRHEKYIVDLWRRAQLKIGRWMQGQLLLALLVGILVYLGLTILGVKNALFLAFLAALFETIPLFGPILSAIPAVLSSYADGGVGSTLLVAGLYIIIHQFENHLIYPLVVKKIVGVPPILVILALLVGWELAGFLGLILSVPVATTLMEYFDDLQTRKMGTQGN
jgi:predicted PurR-regulated permease PerM